MGHSTATGAGEAAHAGGAKHLILTNLRSSRFVAPEALLAEAKSALGGPVKAANDLDTFGF
jgi:ribonuclease BN (tRNA processing enzyme)